MADYGGGKMLTNTQENRASRQPGQTGAIESKDDRKRSREMVSHLFFKMLPVQAGLVAMGSANSIIDGIVAARFIDPETVGVIGLYYTMLRILEAVAGLLIGGTAVLCGKYMGAGKVDKTRGVCSLSLAVALIIGTVLTAVSFIAPGAVSRALGANSILTGPLSSYVKGYAFGIIPLLMGQLFAQCLQMERQDKRGLAAIVSMILSNAVLDVIFVSVMDMGLWGLALATSISNWVYFLIVASYYLKENAQLKPRLGLIEWEELPGLIKIGAPNALLVVCLAFRNLVINRLMIRYTGVDGLSALSAFNMTSGFILAISLGAGAVVRMLSSVFLGEENREGLLDLVKIVLTRMIAVILVLSAAVSLLAPVFAGIFFPDRTSEVFNLSRQLFFIYGFSMPLSYICLIYSNYAQAAGFMKYVHMISVCDGFLSMVIPALLLTPRLGALGMWLAFPIGLVITDLITLIYIVIRNGRRPRDLSEGLLLDPKFGTNPHLIMTITDSGQIGRIANQVQEFCGKYNFEHRVSMHVGLCMEEMALNIFQHGFGADRKKHLIEIRIVIQEETIVLRIKDDCIAFNPREWYEITDFSDPTEKIGIHMVYRLADDFNYQNLLGLNVLTIRFNSAQA